MPYTMVFIAELQLRIVDYYIMVCYADNYFHDSCTLHINLVRKE